MVHKSGMGPTWPQTSTNSEKKTPLEFLLVSHGNGQSVGSANKKETGLHTPIVS